MNVWWERLVYAAIIVVVGLLFFGMVVSSVHCSERGWDRSDGVWPFTADLCYNQQWEKP